MTSPDFLKSLFKALRVAHMHVLDSSKYFQAYLRLLNALTSMLNTPLNVSGFVLDYFRPDWGILRFSSDLPKFV